MLMRIVEITKAPNVADYFNLHEGETTIFVTNHGGFSGEDGYIELQAAIVPIELTALLVRITPELVMVFGELAD